MLPELCQMRRKTAAGSQIIGQPEKSVSQIVQLAHESEVA
jgi:hypothetical protein